MENAFDSFVDYRISTRNNNVIFLFDVLKKYPSPFEWTCAKEDFKKAMEELKKMNTNYIYIIDMRLMGILSIQQVKEFVEILESMGDFLETKLNYTLVVAEGSIIKAIYEVMKLFYRTKKPLHIVNTMEQAYQYIDQSKIAP
jgi:glutaredoxin-related protein